MEPENDHNSKSEDVVKRTPEQEWESVMPDLTKVRAEIAQNIINLQRRAKVYYILSIVIWWSIQITTVLMAAFPQISRYLDVSKDERGFITSALAILLGVFTAISNWLLPKKQLKKYEQLALNLKMIDLRCAKQLRLQPDDRETAEEFMDNLVKSLYLSIEIKNDNSDKKNE